jgi:signal transduction histidine kinase
MKSHSSRSSRVRTKVVALLLSLVALWGFAAYVTLREGLNLLWVSTLDQKFGRPTDGLITALQQERRLSLVYLGQPGSVERDALTAQRGHTDEARERFQTLVRSRDVRLAASASAQQRIDEAFRILDRLTGTRNAIDSASIGRGDAAQTFTDIIGANFRVFNSLATLDDPEIAKEGRTLVALTRAREVLSQEDALLAGVLAANHFEGDEHARFVQLVGAQRFLYADSAAELPATDKARYDQLLASGPFAAFHVLEDTVVDRAGTGPLPIDSESWRTAVEVVIPQLHAFELSAADSTVQRATPAAIGVFVRLGLAGGLGLIAVIASIIMSITTARALVRQLARLRTAALNLAHERLPSVVQRLGRGEEVDVEVEAPPLEFGSDEIGQVGEAFNAVQRTAISVAVEQAELRRGVRDVFLSLARRTQALVHRQLTLLDGMERRETTASELEDLFRVDHLATRMRRNAENLIVLSGAVPGRGWRHPVRLVDVVRGAVAEVEDYTRIKVMPIAPGALAGRAVSDVIHLLAELIENAASFSPPYTIVNVGGQRVANGYAIEIEDRGLGMTEADLAVANEQLRTPPDFSLSSTARLGLYVVARLAERHGVRVQLRESPYGGTTAIVLLPTGLVVDDTVSLVSGYPGNGTRALDRTRPLDTETAFDPGRLFEPSAAPLETVREPVVPEPVTAPPAPPPSSPPVPVPVPVDERPPAEPDTATASITYTSFGLPRRIRQASLAGPARTGGTTAAGEQAGRPPDEIRDMLAAYQNATARGRFEAERSLTTSIGSVATTEEPAPSHESDPAHDDQQP